MTLLPLVKMEPELQAALDNMRERGVDPQHHRTIMRRLFADRMVPGMGNALSYQDFLSRPRDGGVHIRMDANDFGGINKVHGFETGNRAISAVGNSIRHALDEVANPDADVNRAYDDGDPYTHKAWRIGGDEFHAHVPDYETAARFARTVREKLDSIAPIGGTHALSLSLGFGADPAQAEEALLHAKTAKKSAGYMPGHAKTHAHSLVPGRVGAIPTTVADLPLGSRRSQPPPSGTDAVAARALPPVEAKRS